MASGVKLEPICTPSEKFELNVKNEEGGVCKQTQNAPLNAITNPRTSPRRQKLQPLVATTCTISKEQESRRHADGPTPRVKLAKLDPSPAAVDGKVDLEHEDQMPKLNSKALALVGDTHALSEDSKLRQTLGDAMTNEQIKKSKEGEKKLFKEIAESHSHDEKLRKRISKLYCSKRIQYPPSSLILWMRRH